MTSREYDGKPNNTSYFTEENWAKLKEIMYPASYPAGSHLFWEGDPADKLYFIDKGRVKVTKATDEGKQLIIYMYQEGDLFGQVDPFHESVHSFGAEFLEDSVVGVIQQKDLEVLLWQHGDLAVEFMKWMGLMHRLTQTKFRDLMLFGKPGALCSLLIRLGNTYGVEREDGLVIGKRLKNNELADMIGTTRETVNRMLGELRKEKVITYDDNCIVITDPEYLRDICHCEDCPKHICRI